MVHSKYAFVRLVTVWFYAKFSCYYNEQQTTSKRKKEIKQKYKNQRGSKVYLIFWSIHDMPVEKNFARETGTRRLQSCRQVVVVSFKALEVLSWLRMNFSIYTDPGPSPLCLKLAENAEVL